MVTPYREDFSIDFGRLAQVVDFLIEGGVHGIISSGTIGEYQAIAQNLNLPCNAFIDGKFQAGGGEFRDSIPIGSSQI